MRFLKPLFKMSGKGMTVIFLVAGLLMVGLGGYFGFFQSRGFEKTTGIITDLKESEIAPDANEEQEYIPMVTYTVGAQAYTEALDTTVTADKLGTEVNILYNPENPTVIHQDSPGMVVYLIVVGAALAAFSLYSLLKNKERKEALSESQPMELFGESCLGEEERRLYFVTDLGTAKGTCHIEDADRNVVYEAVSTKFSLVRDSEYDFVDHERNVRTPHLVGKTVTTSSDAIWVLDNHSTFDLDGRDIWKQLHENGIRIETGLDGLKWAYGIYRDGVEIASVVNTNKLVHEEDAEKGGVLAKVPFPGFFRIRTKEQNLDAIFMTLFAIGRTDMMFYN